MGGAVGEDEKRTYWIRLINGTGRKLSFEQWRSPCVCLESEETVDELASNRRGS